ncbi:hypothetical protein AVO44_03835 [Ruegeria profundi]|uniref:Uncharacterized protein n=1 Tax=Ruegeria profundi TaxID=1685378 RepID=A0A0X3TZP1_9RHOB|nr:hypothetical protein AVO44_03835 [Ruegeria profundi]
MDLSTFFQNGGLGSPLEFACLPVGSSRHRFVIFLRCVKHATLPSICQPLLARLQELFGPTVVEALCNTFTAAEFGIAVLTLQAIQNNPDLFVCGILFASRTAMSFATFSPWLGLVLVMRFHAYA